MPDNLSVTENGIVWDCGFDDVTIVADYDLVTELWTYVVRKGDVAITTRISSDRSPDEESSRGRDSKIKKALSRQIVYVGSIDDVLISLAEFGVCVENHKDVITELSALKSNKTKIIEVSPKKIIDRANDILTHKNPVAFVLDVFETVHKGDRETAELLLISIATQSIINSNGIQPGVNGSSGKGKSHACETMLHLMPEECWINTSLSAKSIFYTNIQPGTIVFSDDVSIGEDLESTIKRSTSNFQKTTMHTTLDSNRIAIKLEIPPRISWWLASVDSEMSTQTINRQFGVTVDESPEMDSVVTKHQLEKAVSGELLFPINDDVLVCREIMREIKKNLFVVTIPFANEIVWTQKSNRRNLPIFLDMIKAFAVLRFRQREIDSNGVLVATKEDFATASELYCRRAETQTTKLSDAELSIVRSIIRYGESDIKAIQRYIGKPESTVRVLLHGRDGKSGMLEKLPGLFRQEVVDKIDDNRSVKKYVYGISDFDILGSYEGIVYLSNNGNSPPTPIKKSSAKKDEWDTKSVKTCIHKYMHSAEGTNRYMSDIGFFQISTQLKELGAPAKLVESTIQHYRDNPNQ